MATADCYVWSLRIAWLGAKKTLQVDSPYHREFHHCHHRGHIHLQGHLCRDLLAQSWEDWGSCPIDKQRRG